jgi:hypothetical protein
MVRILLISRGLRPWFHSTTDHPYLDPAGACGKGTINFVNYKGFFLEKETFMQEVAKKNIFACFLVLIS